MKSGHTSHNLATTWGLETARWEVLTVRGRTAEGPRDTGPILEVPSWEAGGLMVGRPKVSAPTVRDP